MNRLLIILVAMSSFVAFSVVSMSVPGFAQDKAKKEVKIKLVFTDNGWEPEDKGSGNKPEDEPDKWVKVSESSDPPDGMDPGDVIFNENIKVYKKNPCTVCGPSGCYVKQNC